MGGVYFEEFPFAAVIFSHEKLYTGHDKELTFGKVSEREVFLKEWKLRGLHKEI